MKAEEIKLALQKNSETHIQLALIDDAKNNLKTANSLLDLAYKEVREINSGRITTAINKFEETLKTTNVILTQVKELGLSSKETEDIKNIATKNLKEAQAIKTKISSI
jgi:hypothetical protein